MMRVPEARDRDRAWRGRGRGQGLQTCRTLLPEGPAPGSAFLQGTAACDAPCPPSSPIPIDYDHLGFSSGVTASRSPPVSPLQGAETGLFVHHAAARGSHGPCLGHISFQCMCGE